MKYFICIILSLIWLTSTNSCFAERYDNVIVFGDSWSDVGNNTWIKVPGRGFAYRHGAPITNLDRQSHQPKIWLQYLVDKHIFLHDTILPSHLWRGQNLQTENVDYAWAGAETGEKYLNDLQTPFTYTRHCVRNGYITPKKSCVPGVLMQVQQYLSDIHISDQVAGQKSLFIIWAGENDLFDNIGRFIYRLHNQPFNRLFLPSSIYAYSWTPARNIFRAVKLLMHAGVPANHIYIFNLPDLVSTPGAKKLVASHFAGEPSQQQLVLHALNGSTHLFNTNLYLWLKLGLRGKLKPNLIDLYTIVQNMKRGDHFLGQHFNDTTHSCIDQAETPYCSKFLFFNDKHPTTLTGSLLAEMIARNL